MARRRRVDLTVTAGAVADHPWEPPADLDAARDAYMAARARAGEPPLERPGEKILETAQRLRGAVRQSLWNAARFDPDPHVRLTALTDAVAFVRDELATDLDRARFGPRWLRLAEPSLPPSLPRVWAIHGISRCAGPLCVHGHLVMLALRDEPAPELVPLVEDALEQFVADAASVGLRVERECGGAVDLVDPTRRTR